MMTIEELEEKMAFLEAKARRIYAKSLETKEAILALSPNDAKEYSKLKKNYFKEKRKNEN